MMDSQSYKIIISERARQMLEEHVRFLLTVDKEAASKKKERIISAIRSLDTMPQRFPFFNAMYIVPNKYHKMVIDRVYIALYQIKEDRVYVDYILDCRKDYQWILR